MLSNASLSVIYCSQRRLWQLVLRRFNEWGQAVWQLQKSKLSGSSGNLDWRFLSIFSPGSADDTSGTVGAVCRKHEGVLRGKILSAPCFNSQTGFNFSATDSVFLVLVVDVLSRPCWAFALPFCIHCRSGGIRASRQDQSSALEVTAPHRDQVWRTVFGLPRSACRPFPVDLSLNLSPSFLDPPNKGNFW